VHDDRRASSAWLQRRSKICLAHHCLQAAFCRLLIFRFNYRRHLNDGSASSQLTQKQAQLVQVQVPNNLELAAMRAPASCALRKTSSRLVPNCSDPSFLRSCADLYKECRSTTQCHMAAERFTLPKPLQSTQQAVGTLQHWLAERCLSSGFVPLLAALKASAKRLLLALAACFVLHASQQSIASMVQQQQQMPVPHLQQGVVASLYAAPGAASSGAYSSSAAQNAVAYSSQSAETLSAQEVGLRFWRGDAPERTANDVLMDEVIALLKKKYGECELASFCCNLHSLC
jgi:hypothetical protein